MRVLTWIKSSSNFSLVFSFCLNDCQGGTEVLLQHPSPPTAKVNPVNPLNFICYGCALSQFSLVHNVPTADDVAPYGAIWRGQPVMTHETVAGCDKGQFRCSPCLVHTFLSGTCTVLIEQYNDTQRPSAGAGGNAVTFLFPLIFSSSKNDEWVLNP